MAHHPQPERRTGSLEPGRGVVGAHRVDGDALVAEGGTLDEHLEGVEQRLVGAPVDAERLPGRRLLRRVEVGDDVAAAEGVDRLLGVADQDQRGDAVEGALEDLPLHGVGVLELVDQRDLPPLAHPGAGRGVVVGERVGELAEEVVVGEDAQAPLAPVDLVQHAAREAHPCGGLAVGVLGERLLRGHPRTGVADDRAGDAEGVLAAPRGLLLAGEEAQVAVVGDLGGQLLEVLHEDGAGVGVPGDAEAAQHELAELVDGRDRGGVERRQRVGEPREPDGPLLVVGVEQPVVQAVGGVGGRGVGQHGRGVVELAAYAVTQLLAGRAGEGDDEHLLQGGDALDEVARDERGDRPGLAGAGARLQQGGAGRERTADVEGLHCVHVRSPGTSSVASSGDQTRRA